MFAVFVMTSSFAGFSLLKKVLKVEDPYLEWSSTRQSANVPSKNSLCLLCSFSLEILNVYY